jgi:hypothetical protein
MGQDRSDAGFEWVNAWAESARPETATAEMVAAAEPPKPAVTPPNLAVTPPNLAVTPPKPVIVAAHPAPALPDDQLMRDIAEIERVRDALDQLPVAVSFSKRTQALTLVPARTTDPVPVVVGGVLALVMLTVFGAAAAMSKFGR